MTHKPVALRTGPSTTLAKINPPQLGNYYPRARLFEHLDTIHTRPLTWISAPAGYGKTMLVASYLANRPLDTLWYRLDERDSDPGSFFYHLRQAAIASSGQRAESLPIMHANNLPGLSVFAQNFFEQFYALCHAPTIIVLDNLQEIRAQSPVISILPAMARALPDEIRLIFISRNQPPANLARLRSHQQLDLLGADNMALDEEEIKALAKQTLDITLSDAELHTIATQSGGWATGIILMLTQLHETKTLPEAISKVNETVFEYLATEVFERATPELQELLLKTAHLPEVNEDLATALTGLNNAGKMLAELVQKNYFTYRQTTPHNAYHYHPLFQQFLVSRARRDFSPAHSKQLMRQAARLLANKADLDNAAQLAIEGEDWELLGELLLHNTESLLQKGRYLILHQWFEALPDTLRAAQPWLNYWYGNSLLPFDPVLARKMYIQAFEEFQRISDPAGLYLAWAGIVDTYFFLWDEFITLDKWIAVIEEILVNQTEFPGPEIEATLSYGMFCALMYRQPHHPHLPLWQKRVKKLLSGDSALEKRLFMASQYILYLTWTGKLAEAGAIVDMLNAELPGQTNIQPATLTAWYGIEATYYWMITDFPASLQAVQKALDLANKSGVHIWDVYALGQGVYANLTSSRIEQSRHYLQQMEEHMDKTRRLHVGHYHHLASLSALSQNTLPTALEHAQLSCSSTLEMGVPFPQALNHLVLARIYCQQSQYDQASYHLAQGHQLGCAMRSDMLVHQSQLIKAQINFEQGNEAEGLAALQAAMSVGKKSGFFNSDLWQPEMMAFLCGKALLHDIETDYTRQLIRKRKLLPAAPPNELENWPWPLKIHTLGRFTILLDNKPLKQTSKGMNKLLMLLQTLIAMGGREVSEQHLCEALWCDAEGDAAHNTFTTTLHRLRKLLGHDDLIQLKGHFISFNPQRVWVDIWGLERLIGEVCDRLRSVTPPSIDILNMDTQQIMHRYTAPFLQEVDEPWVLTTRERLSSKFLRVVRLLGQAWEKHCVWAQAITLYERALEIDPLAEDIYQALMRCYHQQGRKAEAIAVYQRCQEQFSKVLHISPSTKTELLYQQVTAD